MSGTIESKALTPKELADQLFDAAFGQLQGNYREAARQVIFFLREALVYAVVATAGDEPARVALLKSVADSISGALTATPSTPSTPPTPPTPPTTP